ncbi:MAG: sulfur carrier protein ThiS [Verrucomicrobiota bacterium]
MSKVTIFVNGKARQVDAGISIPDLIAEVQIPNKMLLVEYNGTALLKSKWDQTAVEHGDRIELMKMVAGG